MKLIINLYQPSIATNDDSIRGSSMVHTKANPFLACPETIADARSAHNPAANLAASAEC